MKGIYKFFWDCGYGVLEGIFVETYENVQSIIGKRVYFGEVLGKHSEVDGTIEIGDINLVTEDVETVESFQRYMMDTGYNPFYYLDEEENEQY